VRRAYVDSCVLIVASKGQRDTATSVGALIDSEDCEVVASAYSAMETYPPALHNRKKYPEQLRFFDWFFTAVDVYVETTEELAQLALTECKKVHGLAPMDALHLAAAYMAGASSIGCGIFVVRLGVHATTPMRQRQMNCAAWAE